MITLTLTAVETALIVSSLTAMEKVCADVRAHDPERQLAALRRRIEQEAGLPSEGGGA